MFKTIRSIDWEAIAGVAAAVLALVLHLLHVVEESVLLAVALVLLAIIILRDLRKETREESLKEAADRIEREVQDLSRQVRTNDVLLIGPRRLLEESARFGRLAEGEMVWFNVCLSMFIRQELFDVILRPALENPRVTAIQFILDEGERERWSSQVIPKVSAAKRLPKLREPHWSDLSESVSFILAGTARGSEAHLSFWGEPFMSRTPGGQIPRYIFHVQPQSELIERLGDLARVQRLGNSGS